VETALILGEESADGIGGALRRTAGRNGGKEKHRMLDRSIAPDQQLPLPCAQQRGEAGSSLLVDDEGLMECVVERDNLRRALARVKVNGGSPGVDGMPVAELPDSVRHHWPEIRTRLLAGS
jgi:hypothetical protein